MSRSQSLTPAGLGHQGRRKPRGEPGPAPPPHGDPGGRPARRHRLVVVPGGGSFADEVRRADRRFALGDSAAHWMAILAMDQYAYLLAQLAPGAALVRSRRELAPGRLNVLAPSAWLRRADPLPHSWDVTSDSIAAWVARAPRRPAPHAREARGRLHRAGPRTGQDATHTSDRSRSTRSRGVVDPYFARALDPAIGCWIVRGHLPHRIARLIETGRTRGSERPCDPIPRRPGQS